MKQIKRLFSLLLLFVLAASLTLPASALTLQESYYLQTLYPNLPKDSSSYPARLIVNTGNFNVTLHGTCGMNASLTEEQMLAILKQALGAISGYKELEDAAQDKHLQSQLTEKLKFTDEDVKEVMKNLLSLMGWDDIPDMLNPVSLPDIEAFNGNLFHDYELIEGAFEFGDTAEEIAGMLAGQGDLLDFIEPDMLPSIQDLLYNGAKISWEEFQKDKQKYKDIISLSQANERLRQYYARVDELVKKAQSESGAWAIRIYDQQVAEGKMNPLYDHTVPGIFTADIELVKDDGSFGNINGTYTGRFKLSMDADLTDYDNRRHIIVADYMDKTQQKLSIPGIPGGRTHWSGVSVQVNKPSESKLTLEGDGVSVTLSLPPGVNRTLFELPLDANALEQTECKNTEDIVFTMRGTHGDVVYTTIWTDIKDDSGFQYHHDYNEAVAPGVPPISTENEESVTVSIDVRPYIRMTLVVDML